MMKMMHNRAVRKLTLGELRQEFGLEEAEALHNSGRVWGLWDAGLAILVSDVFLTKTEAEAQQKPIKPR
jgi:hypothetical protein